MLPCRERKARASIGSMFGSLAWPLVLGLAATARLLLARLSRAAAPSADAALLRRPSDQHDRDGPVLHRPGGAGAQAAGAARAAQRAVARSRSASTTRISPPPKPSEWLESLARACPPAARNSYLGRRLTDALETVERGSSAETLDGRPEIPVRCRCRPRPGQLRPGADHDLGDADARLPGHGRRHHRCPRRSGPRARRHDRRRSGDSLNTAMQGLLAGCTSRSTRRRSPSAFRSC